MGIPHFALLRFVWQDYDTTPIRKNQFLLENSAFSLSFWCAILTETHYGRETDGRKEETPASKVRSRLQERKPKVQISLGHAVHTETR